MKIAFSADTHLTSRDSHPGRYAALENILDQMKGEEITTLIMAGDVFDKDLRNYADFEKVAARRKYEGIKFIIIPGNHDAGLSASDIVSDNVQVFCEPELLEIENCAYPILMIPYSEDRTMGRILEEFSDKLEARQWILVGHGDWAGNLRQVNAHEPGIYMPLTTNDLDRHKPFCAFLGHTHMGGISGIVYQLGSPYPMNINETGKRSFLILDSEKRTVEEREVKTDIIFFNESIVMLPTEDEKAYIERTVEQMIQGWELSAHERKRVRLRLRVSGYCSDRAALKANLEGSLGEIRLYEGEGADLSDLSISDDIERRLIAKNVRKRIAGLEWKAGPDEPDRDQILLEALGTIYGG